MLVDMLLVFVFWFVFFSVTFIAYYISENLVKPFNYFDCIPLRCRKCLTTWSLLASYVSVSIIISSWWFLLFGVIITLMEALALHLTDRGRRL